MDTLVNFGEYCNIVAEKMATISELKIDFNEVVLACHKKYGTGGRCYFRRELGFNDNATVEEVAAGVLARFHKQEFDELL